MTDIKPESIPHTVSDRGLAYPEPIHTEYGELVSTYDSSAATQDCIWLGIRGEKTDGDWDEWNVHLTFAQAEQLITQMQWLMGRRAYVIDTPDRKESTDE